MYNVIISDRELVTPFTVLRFVSISVLIDIVEVEANCPDQGGVFEHGSQTEIVEPYRVIHYSCHLGFHLVGNRTQTCGSDGQWSPLHRPQCVTTSE